MRLIIYGILFACLLIGCAPKGIDLEGVDEQAWKDDKHGCEGPRKAILPSLEAAWPQIKGLSEMEVVRTLGKPDRHELYRRSQKFMIYFVEPAPECGVDSDSTALRIHIRLNALGYANELARRTY